MQDKQLRPSRRTVIGGALALAAAPVIRPASAQPAAGVSPQLAELYEKAKPDAEVTIWAPGARRSSGSRRNSPSAFPP